LNSEEVNGCSGVGCWGWLLLPWNFSVPLLSSAHSQNVSVESFCCYVSRVKLRQNSQFKPFSELHMESALIIEASLISSSQLLVSFPLNTGTSSGTPAKSFGNCFLYEQSVLGERLCCLRGGDHRVWVWCLCDWELAVLGLRGPNGEN